jgi:Aldehyde dehydrogenase family
MLTSRTETTVVPTIRPVIAGTAVDSRDRDELFGVDGARLAELRLTPPLLARSALRQVRDAADGVPPDSGIFARAAEIFGGGVVDGETFAAYLDRCALSTGVPKPAVRAACAQLRRVLDEVRRYERLDLPPLPELPGIRTRWEPTGRVFAQFTNAGTHPGGNVYWLRALALGYSVVIRPGWRDPFTTGRLIGALLGAGLPAHQVTLLPGEVRVGHLILEHADVGGIWGPPELTRQWQHRRHVKTNGPGRSKLVIDHDPSAAELDYLAEAVAGEGGVRCDNVSAILTTTDPETLAEALADRLDDIPATPVTDDAAQLPAVAADRAAGVRRQFAELSAGLVDHTARRYGGDPLVALADGSYGVRPVVLSTRDNAHPTVGTELTSPFVVVARWHPDDGVAPLRDSLVVTVLGDGSLVGMVEAEPSITRVVAGPVLPWATVHPSLYANDLFSMLARRRVTVFGGDGR